MVLLDVGLAAPDSLKSTCMNLSEIWVRLDVPALAPGEPVSARHITGWCSEIPRDLNSVPEYKWEGTAALSAAGKTLPG